MKILLLILGIVSFATIAQQRSTPTNEKDLKRQRQQARAIALIEQVGSEAELWDDKRSAVEALANAADLLWDRNPARAGKWLRKAWDLVDQVPESEQNPTLKEFVRQSDKAQLKSIVLRVAHSHDPKLADKFVAEIAEEQPEQKKERGAFDDRTPRSEQLLWLAQQALETNPQLAFNLAQRSLTDGVSFTLQNLMTGLHKKDVALGNQLFDLALARFSNGASEPSEAEVLAGYLFQPGISFSSNAAGQVMMTMNPAFRNEPAVFKTEPDRARRFLVAAYQMFFTRPLPLETPEEKQRAQKIWVFGNRNSSRYDSVAPEFSVPLKTSLAQLESKLFPEGRGDPFANSRKPGGEPKPSEKEVYESRIAALEERAEKTVDPAARNLAWVEVALAVDVEDYPRAKSFAEKISDETLKADAISFVLYRSALAQVRKKELEKAGELAPQIANIARRAVVKIAIAQSLFGDQSAAEMKLAQQKGFDLLNEVERELRKEEPSANVAKILLGRVALVAMVDNDQALVALEQSLQAINKLGRFDLKNNAAPKLGIKGSWRSENLADIPRIGFSFRSAIEPLVPTEFDNLVNLADSLKAREIRGLVQLEIARVYLEQVSSTPR
ncbi:MAG TPA: hypothetical protein VHS05_18705 [Pyrinomonadaceae bacterium]|jgi:hypothetical protein|nr:hypothetical protein [Pyrinomonadaceae bacterium]